MDINDIFGLVILGVTAFCIVVGIYKGGTRSIIAYFTSSCAVLIISAGVAFILPALLADVAGFDLVAKIGEIEFIADLGIVDPIIDNVINLFGGIELSILYIAIVIVAIPIVYLGVSFVFFLLKCILVGIFRGIRPKLVDYIFGIIIWIIIGWLILAYVVVIISILYSFDIGFINEIFGPLFEDGGIFEGIIIDLNF